MPYSSTVDKSALRAVFPYGKLMEPELMDGGMLASSGCKIEELGDRSDEMLIAVAVVTVGY